jgi:F-type H+-transporting ATPase subunit b
MSNFVILAAAESGGMADMVKNTAEVFGFNWWLFLSNLLSFCIVCILLQKFAYKPILNVLEERRERIAEGLANADKIKQQLAEAEVRYNEILTKANADAQKMLEEAKASAAVLSDRKTQQAISEAEQIIAKAREAAVADHDRMLAELKREVGRLVINTTTKVTGKILTPEDQKRISEETAGQVAA